jgi:NAD(P)-dependent dehydrogenase (short-subunit alcohol dehydrogenase family)
MKITDKIALVTGASEGIGKAITEHLVSEGVKVVAVSRTSEESRYPDGVIAKNCDVSKLADVKKLVEFITAEFGQLDIVVNNAGVWQKVAQLDEIDDTLVEAVIDTNLKGTIYVTKHCLALLRKASEAALVNIVSKSGIVAQAGQAVYTASKFGAKGFTDVLREDLKETNIHILGVYQAGTNTEMFAKTGEDFPTEKFTQPEDLAATIVGAIGAPEKFWVNELHVNYR